MFTLLSRPENMGRDMSSKYLTTEGYGVLVRRRGGSITAPQKLAPSEDRKGGSRKLSKLLMNVNIERSIGQVQVIMSPENTVGELIKAATKIYLKEKRRPLLKETDPKFLALHYSPYSLESLRQDEKLMNLGSRNFFLYPKWLPTSGNSHGSVKTTDSPFTLTKLTDLLLSWICCCPSPINRISIQWKHL